MTFDFVVGRTLSRSLRPPLSSSDQPLEPHSKRPTSSSTSPRRRKSSPRTPPRSSRTCSVTPLDVDADVVDDLDLESSTAMSEVSLVVEVTRTTRKRSGRMSTDALVPSGSPAGEKELDAEMTSDLAVCCDTRIAAVDDDAGESPGGTAVDSALSLFLDENLGDVMTMGFAEDGSGEREWTVDSGKALDVSEDASSSDIDVELRRIVASVAHNHDMEDVTSDDDVPPATAPPSTVEEQVLAVLDVTTSGPSLVDSCLSHVTVASSSGCHDNVSTSTSSDVAAARGDCKQTSSAVDDTEHCCPASDVAMTTVTESSGLTESADADVSESMCRLTTVDNNSDEGLCSTVNLASEADSVETVSHPGAGQHRASSSDKSSDVAVKKDDLSNSQTTSVKTVAHDVKRASVATQTNTDLLGRYFHRRSRPVSSFLGASKQSRSAGVKSSRVMSKSTVNSWSSSGGTSAYQFSGSTTSNSVSSPGGAVLLTSGPPLVGPLSGINGKTTFLITVPANFTLPPAVIGPAAKPSSSQLVARTGSGNSSTATALVLGQTPLQLLVAAASALTTSSSPAAVTLSLTSSQSSCGSVPAATTSGAQSASLRRDVMSSSLTSHVTSQHDSMVHVATSSSSAVVTSTTVAAVRTSVLMLPVSSAVTSPSVMSGARHVTIASLPRVATRRRSDVVPQSSSTLMNGRPPPATVPAPSTVRQDVAGAKSPVGGTTPSAVAKQPAAPPSIIRAILERNLHYHVDDASPRTCVEQDGQAEDQRGSSVDCLVAERQNSAACSRKRTALTTYQPAVSAKQRRSTTDVCTAVQLLSKPETDLTPLITSRYSAASVTSGGCGLSSSAVDSQQTTATSEPSDSAGRWQQGDVETVQVERTTSTTRALPKKVYAYLGSAGAAASALGDLQPSVGATTPGHRDMDGPISHLRLMCSGLTAPPSEV